MMMKRYFLANLCCIVFSCEPKCNIEIEIPSDINPIDWESYNDVYSVWWSFRSNDGVVHEDLRNRKTIKIYGIMDRYYSRFSSHLGGNNEILFYLRDEYKREFSDPDWPDCNEIEITLFPDISIIKEELLEKFDTWTSRKKRIYIKGALTGGAGGPPRCPDSIYPRIIVKNLDDIFESDKNNDNE